MSSIPGRIYPMFIEPTITWVPSVFSGYIWLDTKKLCKKNSHLRNKNNVTATKAIEHCHVQQEDCQNMTIVKVRGSQERWTRDREREKSALSSRTFSTNKVRSIDAQVYRTDFEMKSIQIKQIRTKINTVIIVINCIIKSQFQIIHFNSLAEETCLRR